MPILSWTDSFSVNSNEMDAQHKRLFALVNNLHDAMRDGKGKEALGTTLDGLISYTRIHFAEEERLMAKVNYPELAAHKQEHDAFTKKVLDLQAQFKSGEAALTFTLMDFLKDWLTNHILKKDKKYSVYVK